MGLRQGKESAPKSDTSSDRRQRISASGQLLDWESRAGRAAHRSEREKTPQLKLEKVAQFNKEQRPLVTCLMETWRVTPNGWGMTPEDRRRAVAQRAAEIAERRAIFDANSNN